VFKIRKRIIDHGKIDFKNKSIKYSISKDIPIFDEKHIKQLVQVLK
jgi:hypothetical protein